MRRILIKLTASALLTAGSIGLASCGSERMPVFDKDAAWKYLTQQCNFGPRIPGSRAHDAVAELITNTLESSGWTVEKQRFSIADPYGEDSLHLVNVIGRLRPDRTKRIMLATHFDTRPRADNEKIDSLKVLPIPGANDGASGVAVLLALAQALGARPPERFGVDFVFFDGEDYGRKSDFKYYLLGSKYFASTLSASGGYHPVCGILLDMVGGKDAVVYKELNSLKASRQIVDAIFDRARRLNLDMFVDKEGTAIYDDHIPLILSGIKAIDLIDTNYAFWHTLQDEPANCSKESLRQTGVLLVDFLYNFPF